MLHAILNSIDVGRVEDATVASLLGVCDRTVRRRFQRTLRALRAAAPAYTRAA